tara:strand:+ start:1279 stop:1914 length:636 start_codon:yes stop_codon:yes gene_type:complete
MALYKYTFDEVIQEICSRVNDPDRDTYGDRAKELFYEAAVTLVKDGNFNADDVPGLITFKKVDVSTLNPKHEWLIESSQVGDDGNPDTVLGEVCIRLLSIIDDYEDNEFADHENFGINQHKYMPITVNEYASLIDPENRPYEDEIYYWRMGSKVRFYPKESMVGQNVIVQFVKHPQDFSTDAQLQGDFSLDFIYKIINYSVAKLKQEMAGE